MVAGEAPGSTAERSPTAQMLIVHAVQAFAAQGYDGASLREVERQADVNRGQLSYYFGSKDQLWRSCIDWLMEKFHAEMTTYKEILRLVSPAERERLLLKIYVRFAAKHPEFFRMLVVEGSSYTERAEWIATRLRQTLEFFEVVTDRHEDFSSARSAAMSYYLFVGAASMLFAVPAQCKYLFGVEPDEAMLEQFSDLVVDVGVMVRRHPSNRTAAAERDEHASESRVEEF